MQTRGAVLPVPPASVKKEQMPTCFGILQTMPTVHLSNISVEMFFFLFLMLFLYDLLLLQMDRRLLFMAVLSVALGGSGAQQGKTVPYTLLQCPFLLCLSVGKYLPSQSLPFWSAFLLTSQNFAHHLADAFNHLVLKFGGCFAVEVCLLSFFIQSSNLFCN